ncbi:MAG: alpha/beta hydrolase family protein [bacterium]
MTRTALRAIVFLLTLTCAAATPSRAAAPPFSDGYGIHVEAVEQLDARQLNVRVSTAALQHPVDVRILLPSDYAADPERDYPVLYLFHGTSGRASDWVNAGGAVPTTAGLPLIVVMSDAGFNGDGGGWFANWFNGGAGGQPMWETYHVEQLVPWIDANLRTVADQSGRAIAGLSQGGFGALSYAARHPDLFTSVAAFSGGGEIERDAEAIRDATVIIQYITSVLSHADPDAVFGPRATQELNWQAHDPATLVTNLRGMDIELWTGDGTPGPLDPVPPDPGAVSIEIITFNATRLFHGHLDDAWIAHGYHYYGGGTHIFPYWARDLQEYIGPLMARFAAAPPPPRSISYLSAADAWQQWGWQVTLHRPIAGFSHLRHASSLGFALTGTGSADVETPAVYQPGTRVRVVMRGRGIRSTALLTVGASGSLSLAVPLGDDARPRTTRVSIRALRSPTRRQ